MVCGIYSFHGFASYDALAAQEATAETRIRSVIILNFECLILNEGSEKGILNDGELKFAHATATREF